MPRRNIRTHWPILVLAGAPIVLLAPIVLSGRVLYWGVPMLQFYGWQRMAVEYYQAGQLPLWNPLVGNGAPLAANLQTGAFYPFNFLYLLLPTEYAMGYTAALHVILAGLFMYAFLRSLKLSSLAALIGALAFQLCGFLIARLSFFSVTATFPWLAAWLWRAEALHLGMRDAPSDPPTHSVGHGQGGRLRERSAVLDIVLLALVIGLGVLAGHAQTAVYGLIMVAAYFLWRVITDRQPAGLAADRPINSCRFRSVALSLAVFVVAVALGLSLAAIQLIPAAELARESQRAGGLDYTQVMTHSFWPLRLLTMLSPDFFGNPAQNNFWGYDNYWENAAYIGLIPLLLALWAVWEWLRSLFRRRPGVQASERHTLIAFFAVAAIISLLLSFGWFTPLYPWLFRFIPGFALFQGPARWLVVTTVCLCVLAGLGAQRWIDHGISRRAASRLIVLGLALILAGLVASRALPGRIATFGPATLRPGILLLAAGFIFRSRIQNPTGMLLSPKLQIALVAVIVLDLITAHFALNPTLPPDIYHAQNPSADAVRAGGLAGRVFYFGQDEQAVKFGVYLAHDQKFDGYGPSDLNFWLGEREALIPNVATIDRLSLANNFDSLIVGRYQSLVDQINSLPIDQALPLLSRMNVAYIVSPRKLDLPVLHRAANVTIYRNDKVLPRAWIAPASSDLSQVSTIEEGSTIESLTDSGNAITIRATSPRDGWLILTDVWYPGWQAMLDGAQVEIQMANGAFRAVHFPAGAHTVEFRYEPRSVSVGIGVTLISLLLIAGALTAGVVRRIRRR